MKDLLEIATEIKEVCKAYPVMEDRIIALKQLGYENIEYRYIKHDKVILPPTYQGLLATTHLPKKNIYRIQIGYNELLKGYPAGWCVDVSSEDVSYVQELPF